MAESHDFVRDNIVINFVKMFGVESLSFIT